MRDGIRLGVDVGSVRVGLAVCDAAGVLATPVATLHRDAGANADVRQVATEAGERGAIEVVVGLPRSLDGHEGAAAEIARAWAATLRSVAPDLPIRMVDERLTTVESHRLFREANISTRQSRSFVDQQAAVMILQAALDAERVSGQPAGQLLGARKPRHRGRSGAKGQQE